MLCMLPAFQRLHHVRSEASQHATGQISRDGFGGNFARQSADGTCFACCQRLNACVINALKPVDTSRINLHALMLVASSLGAAGKLQVGYALYAARVCLNMVR